MALNLRSRRCLKHEGEEREESPATSSLSRDMLKKSGVVLPCGMDVASVCEALAESKEQDETIWGVVDVLLRHVLQLGPAISQLDSDRRAAAARAAETAAWAMTAAAGAEAQPSI